MENNTEIKQTETKETERKSFWSQPWVQSAGGIILIILIVGGFLVWKDMSQFIKIDNSQILAPTINLGPDTSGVLTEVYVQEGDMVLPNTPVARVGNTTITAQVPGVITMVDKELGKTFNPGQTVVSMINPLDLRVVGKIDENKGLADIYVGEPATFTVDAFGGETFTGVVDTIAPTSDASGAAF